MNWRPHWTLRENQEANGICDISNAWNYASRHKLKYLPAFLGDGKSEPMPKFIPDKPRRIGEDKFSLAWDCESVLI